MIRDEAVFGKTPAVEFQLKDGTWVFPDCGYRCRRCKACLGCVRKFMRSRDDKRLVLRDERDPYTFCKDGLDHVCAGES